MCQWQPRSVATELAARNGFLLTLRVRTLRDERGSLARLSCPGEEARRASMVNPNQRRLAIWLLRRDVNESDEPDVVLGAAERSLQMLCVRLAKLVTASGCQLLLARAIHLAAVEDPVRDVDRLSPECAWRTCGRGGRVTSTHGSRVAAVADTVHCFT